MSEPVKLDPIFGAMFGDHAEDCACDTCLFTAREQAEAKVKSEELRAAHAAEMRADGMELCEACGKWFDDRELDDDGECSECARRLEDNEP